MLIQAAADIRRNPRVQRPVDHAQHVQIPEGMFSVFSHGFVSGFSETVWLAVSLGRLFCYVKCRVTVVKYSGIHSTGEG